MGSRLHYRSTANTVLILIGIIVFLTSCLPPGMHLWFPSEDGARKKLSLELSDVNIRLALESFTNFGPYCKRYYVGLTIRIKCADDISSRVAIDPSAVAVQVYGREMEIHHNYPQHTLDTLSRREFVVGAVFESSELDLGSLQQGFALPVDIVLDGLITIDGEPIVVETIRAYEKQRCI